MNERNSSDYSFYLLSTLGDVNRMLCKLHNSRGHHSHKLQYEWDYLGLCHTEAQKVHKVLGTQNYKVNREKSADASKFLDCNFKISPWGMQTGTATMQNNMEVLQEIKTTHTICSSIPTYGHLPQRNTNSKNYVYPHVHCIIYKS